MQFLRHTICCLSVAILASCSYERVINKSVLDSCTDSLSLSPVLTDNISGIVLGLLCTSDFIVFCLDNPEFHFAAMPLSFDRPAFYFGRVGRGPGELVHADFKSIKTSGGNTFSVFDSGQFKNISLAEDNVTITTSDESLKLSGPFNGLKKFGEGYIDVNMQDANDDFEYVCYDSHGDISGYLSKYPDWADDSGNKLFCYIKHFITSEDGNHLAAFYGHFPRARFISSGSRKVRTVKLDLPHESENVLSRRCYVGQPFAAGDIISSLYQGKNYSEIHRWHWDGTFVKRTVLSSKVSFFCYSQDFRCIFAWDGNDERLYVSQ